MDTPATTPSSSNLPSGLKIDARGDVTAGGDIVGRDKVTHNYYLVNQVADGLTALNRLMQQNAGLRVRLLSLRDQFQAATGQIQRLSNYKDIHDFLHQMEFECYRVLVQTEPRFGADPATRREVRRYRITLERLLADLTTAAQQTLDPGFELDWVEALKTVPGQLDDAIRQSSVALLAAANRQLKDELELQPARINHKLVEAAGGLRLTELAQGLRLASQDLPSVPDLDAGQLQSLTAGLAELTHLSQRLETLARDHDGWQDLDVRLGRIEALIPLDARDGQMFAELKRTWPRLNSRGLNLARSRNDDFASAFLAAATALEDQLMSAPPEVLSDLFLDYRTYAGEIFVQVDVDLRSLCGDLRIVGERLTESLRMLQ